MLSRRTFLAAAAIAPLAKLQAAEAPKFKPGLISYNVAKDWDVPTILRICKSAGIGAFEARTTHKHGIEIKLTKDERATVKKQFNDAGVLFWSCGSACEFHSPDAKVVQKNVEETKQFLQLAADLGGKGVKVRPNGVDKSMTVEQACTQIGKALVDCGKAAEDLGLEVWVEVHGATTQIPKNMKLIMEACGHKAVGVCWNSNATDVAEKSIAANFDLLKPWIKHCHINDLENDKAGKYPYRELFKKLREIGYDRYTMCEVGKSYDPKAGEEFLKNYVAMWKELAG